MKTIQMRTAVQFLAVCGLFVVLSMAQTLFANDGSTLVVKNDTSFDLCITEIGMTDGTTDGCSCLLDKVVEHAFDYGQPLKAGEEGRATWSSFTIEGVKFKLYSQDKEDLKIDGQNTRRIDLTANVLVPVGEEGTEYQNRCLPSYDKIHTLTMLSPGLMMHAVGKIHVRSECLKKGNHTSIRLFFTEIPLSSSEE